MDILSLIQTWNLCGANFLSIQSLGTRTLHTAHIHLVVLTICTKTKTNSPIQRETRSFFVCLFDCWSSQYGGSGYLYGVGAGMFQPVNHSIKEMIPNGHMLTKEGCKFDNAQKIKNNNNGTKYLKKNAEKWRNLLFYTFVKGFLKDRRCTKTAFIFR